MITRVAVLLALVCCLYGCGPRVLNQRTIITAAVKTYTVARTIANPNAYIIYAKDNGTAQQAADEELNCSKTVCRITPAGVIYFVEIVNDR